MSEQAKNWSAVALTLFPEMFPGPLGHSLAGTALTDGAWSMTAYNIRDFAQDKHRTVDDAPFGGGPGMVMRPDVIDTAISKAKADHPGLPLVYMTPRGRPLTQATVKQFAEGPGLVLLCGRFEGVDQRVLDAHDAIEVSAGDFVLSGGETAALLMLDACVRLLPGVIGKQESLIEESFETGLLEYPHYTRPQVWRDQSVPDVLLSGHHSRIEAWRLEMAEQITRERRPDLWDAYRASK